MGRKHHLISFLAYIPACLETEAIWLMYTFSVFFLEHCSITKSVGNITSDSSSGAQLTLETRLFWEIWLFLIFAGSLPNHKLWNACIWWWEQKFKQNTTHSSTDQKECVDQWYWGGVATPPPVCVKVPVPIKGWKKGKIATQPPGLYPCRKGEAMFQQNRGAAWVWGVWGVLQSAFRALHGGFQTVKVTTVTKSAFLKSRNPHIPVPWQHLYLAEIIDPLPPTPHFSPCN